MTLYQGLMRVSDIRIDTDKVKQIILDEDTVIFRDAPLTIDWLRFKAQSGACTIRMRCVGSCAPNMEYSSDGGFTWVVWDYSSITLSRTGDEVLMRGHNPNGISAGHEDYAKFQITGSVAVSGNIMTLIDGVGMTEIIPPSDFCFYNLFNNCPITSAPDLPATVLGDHCYYQMFAGTNITVTPELPAPTLKWGCYEWMFRDCEYLTDVSPIHATALAQESCHGMFLWSPNLSISDAPTEGATAFFTCPSTTGLYRPVTTMFSGTAGPYTSPPVDGATYYCSAPDYLKFTSTGTSTVCLAHGNSSGPYPDCKYSFDKQTWSDMPISGTDAPVSMADGQSIYVKGINPDGFSMYDSYGNLHSNWFVMTGSIAASGSVMSLVDGKGLSLVIPSPACFDELFVQCYVLTSAPRLPALLLMPKCYQFMFYWCVSLTAPPDLPAPTLASKCYCYMLEGCQSIKIRDTPAEGATLFITMPSTIPAMAVSYMFMNTRGTYTSDPVANGKYYHYQ